MILPLSAVTFDLPTVCVFCGVQEEKSVVAQALARVGAVEAERDNAVESHKTNISKLMLDEQQLRDKVSI